MAIESRRRAMTAAAEKTCSPAAAAIATAATAASMARASASASSPSSSSPSVSVDKEALDDTPVQGGPRRGGGREGLKSSERLEARRRRVAAAAAQTHESAAAAAAAAAAQATAPASTSSASNEAGASRHAARQDRKKHHLESGAAREERIRARSAHASPVARVRGKERLRRQSSVEYDPDNPFDDVPRQPQDAEQPASRDSLQPLRAQARGGGGEEARLGVRQREWTAPLESSLSKSREARMRAGRSGGTRAPRSEPVETGRTKGAGVDELRPERPGRRPMRRTASAANVHEATHSTSTAQHMGLGASSRQRAVGPPRPADAEQGDAKLDYGTKDSDARADSQCRSEQMPDCIAQDATRLPNPTPGQSHHTLSQKTSQSLANLEFMLEMLKSKTPTKGEAHSTPPFAKECILPRRRDDLAIDRSERSLSPSKELHARSELVARTTEKQRTSAGSPRKQAFLARVEQSRRAQSPAPNSTEPKRPSHGKSAREKSGAVAASINKDKGSLQPRFEQSETVLASLRPRARAQRFSSRDVPEARKEQNDETSDRAADFGKADLRSNATGDPGAPTSKLLRRKSLSAYIAPGISGELEGADSTEDADLASTSSIVIGDESLDDILRSHGPRLFMEGLSVLVDVRDQDGDDASSAWIEKLRSVGATVLSKAPVATRRKSSGEAESRGSAEAGSRGSRVDYIVYKNGKPATLHWYRARVEEGSAPAIVGVNWILACLREGKPADVQNYLVEVGKQPAFAKRRTSMTPRRAPVEDVENLPVKTPYSELLARRKSLSSAPANPSPLARRCWNMDSSTSSIATSATATTTTNGGPGPNTSGPSLDA